LVGLARFWRALKAADQAAGRYSPTLGIAASVVRTLTPIFTHGKFGKCTASASRRVAHLGVFYGFAALFLVSVWAVIALYMINPLIPGHDNDLLYPFGLLNPWKLLANLGALALIAGCVLTIRDRIVRAEESGVSTPSDWIFVGLLLGVGVSGLLTEILRFVAEPARLDALEYTAYAVYFVHLVLVFDLLVYLPYSKFAHIAYRTAAMIYAEHSGRTQSEAENA
jgi:quinone-modifying oxidoreductase subunit QmoC